MLSMVIMKNSLDLHGEVLGKMLLGVYPNS